MSTGKCISAMDRPSGRTFFGFSDNLSLPRKLSSFPNDRSVNSIRHSLGAVEDQLDCWSNICFGKRSISFAYFLSRCTELPRPDKYARSRLPSSLLGCESGPRTDVFQIVP